MKGRSKVKVKRLHHQPKAAVRVGGASVPVAATAKPGEHKVREYGQGNKLPHDIIKTFLASPTARRCIDKLKKFIVADGFADRTAAAVQVNPQQTADDILPLLGWDSAVIKGIVFRVKYRHDGEVGEGYHVPLHTVRKLEDGRFLVNPTLGSKKYKKELDEILEPFDNSPETVLQVVAEAAASGQQPGQILYLYEENSAQPYYPEPDAWAAKEDIESDTEIPKADHNDIVKRVKPNVGVHIPGEIDDQNKDEDGRTEWDYIEEQVKALTDPDGEGDPVVFNGENPPKLLEMPGMKASLPMDQKSDTIRRRVCMAFGVHPVLIGMETPGQLGDVQQMLTVIQLMQQEVLGQQNLIQRAFSMLFPAFDWTLSSLNILKSLPDQVWQTMDENEKRNFLGLAEVEVNDELDRFNRLPDALKAKVLEAMTPEQVLKLTGFAEEENKPQPKALTKPQPRSNGTDQGGLSELRAFLKKYFSF